LFAYKRIQSKVKGFKDPTMEKLAAADKQGKLKSHIKSVMASAGKSK
jgi:hypothetical protein